MRLSLTLVVPCYREAERLAPDPFLEFLGSTTATRLLFVDDGSPDQTLQLLRDLAARQPERIEVLALPHNVGKGEAVRLGLLEAMKDGPDLVGFWDADLSAPLFLAAGFVAVLERSPGVRWVLGSRWRGLGRQIRRNAARHYLSRVFATVVSLMLRLPVYDTQCGAKVFRADPVLRQVLSIPFASRWIFDVEMLARFMSCQGRTAAATELVELPLDVWVHDGKSHLAPLDFLTAAVDLARIRRRQGG